MNKLGLKLGQAQHKLGYVVIVIKGEVYLKDRECILVAIFLFFDFRTWIFDIMAEMGASQELLNLKTEILLLPFLLPPSPPISAVIIWLTIRRNIRLSKIVILLEQYQGRI